MGYDYDIHIAGQPITTTYGVEGARFLKYTTGARRGNNLIIPFKHGELSVPDKYFEGADVLLEVFLPSDSHDAAAAALSALAEEFARQALIAVRQTDPHRGTIRAMTEMLTDPVPTQNEFVYLFALRNPSGFWEDLDLTEVSAGTPPSVTTLGDRPIDDMILTFSGPGFLEHTDPIGQVARIEIDAEAGAGTYVVNVGKATVKKSGVNQDQYLIVTQPWWMKFQPNGVQDLDSDVAVAVDFRNKWS